MPTLIFINGPPAAGKSTLARLYADEHPLALNLDIDRVRAMLGRWRDDPGAAGLAARRIAVAASRAHLAAGHDVVIPQLVARLDFIARLEAAATGCGARFCEVFLLDELENLKNRYRERARLDAAAPGPDAALSTDQTDAELAACYQALLPVLTARPGTVVIRTGGGDVTRAYRELLAAVDGSPRTAADLRR